MKRKEQIQEILDAIERKDYKISYDEPDCVYLRNENGNKYFIVSGDDCCRGAF